MNLLGVKKDKEKEQGNGYRVGEKRTMQMAGNDIINNSKRHSPPVKQ